MGFDYEGATMSFYDAAKAFQEDPPGIVALCNGALGRPDAVILDSRSPRLPRGMPSAFLEDDLEIHVTPQQSVLYRNFLVGHEGAEYHLWTIDYPGLDIESVANRLGSHLQLPRPAFIEHYRLFRGDLRQLAMRFGVSETQAALRIGEVFFRPVLVTTRLKPVSKRYWQGPTHPELLAELVTVPEGARILRGLQRIPLTDHKGRFAFLDRGLF